jgi:stringent starvation protein B
MTPSRPYFVRAVYEWLNDNNMTPYLLLDATAPGVRVPTQFVKDGRITLNIAPGAINNLFIRNEGISFGARFSGSPMQIDAPMTAVLAIFARENGEGLFFEQQAELGDNIEGEEAEDAAPSDADEPPEPTPPEPTPPKRPSLRVVK